MSVNLDTTKTNQYWRVGAVVCVDMWVNVSINGRPTVSAEVIAKAAFVPTTVGTTTAALFAGDWAAHTTIP